MSLRRALVLLVMLVLAAGLVPAGLLLDRRLGDALMERTREDLARAPVVLDDRLTSVRAVRMMHAREVAALPTLASAIADADMETAARIVEQAIRAFQEEPILVGPTGPIVEGPGVLPPELIDATRRGEMPVVVTSIGGSLHLVAIAPVVDDGEWMGAAGGSTPFGDSEAGTLAGLTRSDVIIVSESGEVVGSTLDRAAASSAAAVMESTTSDGDLGTVTRITLGESTAMAVAAPLDRGRVVFLRDLDVELAVLPALRRTALAAGALALGFALFVGTVFAARLSRPVSELADAAEGFASGRPDTPIGTSSITEVRRMGDAFASMRRALANRLRELEDRQDRLSTLQAELVQRERLAASGRLLAQLAHEIRNPVASVRNCLEVVRRKGQLEGEAAEFADMAVDELLRMHELAERMLDLHRPRDPADRACDVVEVARETAQLARAGAPPEAAPVAVVGEAGPWVGIAADSLKQVLLNLVLNAREVSEADAPVEIVVTASNGRVQLEVLDRGPGIDDDVVPRLFDPFFTTKEQVRGVGLGLYTAEGLVRAAGGTLNAGNRQDGPGARFVIDLPAVGAGKERST